MLLAAQWLALAVVTLLGAVLVVDTLRTGISPYPSTAAQRAAVLAQVPLDFAGRAYELGAGWGGLAWALARARPRATVVAVETAWVPWAALRLRRTFAPVPNLVLLRADFLKLPLGDGALFVCYLFRGAMRQLSEKLAREAQPGALLVTHTFALPGRVPASTVRLADATRTVVDVHRL
jgi:hypothetical protein